MRACVCVCVLQVYADYESNPLLRQGMEFCCRQFYVLHRKPFVLQLFASVAPLLEFSVRTRTHIYTHAHLCRYTHIYAHAHLYYTHIYTHTPVLRFIYTIVSIPVPISIYTCTYLYYGIYRYNIHTYIHISIYTYIYMYYGIYRYNIHISRYTYTYLYYGIYIYIYMVYIDIISPLCVCVRVVLSPPPPPV